MDSITMVHALYNNGANSIWEHSLLDPGQGGKGTRRKPNSRDPVHPVKADFIRAKHQMLVFVLRPGKDSSMLDEELSKQLHSSVRTANVETSLRLLSLGADPNYIHPEKGTSCLHVAAKEDQASQVELLVVYGADAGILDVENRTPVQYARDSGYHHLADRLVECQYELTDRLAHYLCGRKPDHQSNQHYIIPEMADSSLDLSELAKAAKVKLQALPNHLFEELAMDVYDEVDRRETDAIWLSMQSQSSLISDRQCVPFLPVNPEFSATRNQGRQKLARFNAREFTTLIIDILSDAKRRQFGSAMVKENCGMPVPRKAFSTISDDEPLYDVVASDDEIGYSKFREDALNKSINTPASTSRSSHTMTVSTSNNSTTLTPSSSSSDSQSQKSLGLSEGGEDHISIEDYLNTKRQLEESNKTIRMLYKTNDDMKDELIILQKLVQNLMKENLDLKANIHVPRTDSSYRLKMNGLDPIIPPPPQYLPNKHADSFSQRKKTGAQTSPLRSSPTKSPSSHQRPVSMYEPREQQKVAKQMEGIGANLSNKSSGDSERIMSRDDSGLGRSSHHSRQSCDYDGSEMNLTSCVDKLQCKIRTTSPLQSSSCSVGLPTQKEIIHQTKPITRCIQELLSSAQEGKQHSFVTYSERIYCAVSDMVALFPEKLEEKNIQSALQKLLGSALRLHAECKQRQVDKTTDGKSIDLIIQRAYDIALANKELVNSVHEK
ncbi:ARF GTPase-activating protein GIT1 [Nymphon striatum]|nr:ARF GTPase-activating protein GIT1 [Nymphon striatum]